jgi:EpsI family protein
MGQSFDIRLFFAVILLLITGIIVNGNPASKPVPKKEPLIKVLNYIDGNWHQGRPIPLDERVVNALSLDDYLFHEYVRENKTITLYIGYYLTSDKLGSAHIPLVCFPGQGWMISEKEKGEMVVNSSPKITLSYSSMLAEREKKKLYVLYWYQAYDQTSADTFSQKSTSLMQKIMRKKEDNAFVRISCPVENNEVAECKDSVLSFAKAFYPSFLDYVKGTGE